MRQAVLIGVIALGACSGGDNSRAMEMARATSMNPSAVEFEQVHTGQAGLICGRVNYPNEQGGFSGFRVFVYDGQTLLTSPSFAEIEALLNRPASDRASHDRAISLMDERSEFMNTHASGCDFTEG